MLIKQNSLRKKTELKLSEAEIAKVANKTAGQVVRDAILLKRQWKLHIKQAIILIKLLKLVKKFERV